MNKQLKYLAFIALFAGAAPLTVCAQTAAPAAKRGEVKGSTIVQVTNSRSVALKELDATPAGLFLPKAIVSNLGPGKKTSAKVATDKDCLFDLRGDFVDGSKTEFPGVNLCKDPTVNLVD